jgi:hypothetical protein
MRKLTDLIKKVDNAHLEAAIPFLILVIIAPILYLYKRDGIGSGIFAFHDQLDETILSYVFAAKYFGKDIYEQMFYGGIPTASLKPNAILFVLLYRIFNVYFAFLIQYVIVVATAFFGMYFCLKNVFKSGSIVALSTGFLFALLPFLCVYGNSVAGTPLVILCVYSTFDEKLRIRIFSYLGLAYYALTAGIVLSGWAVLGFVLLFFIVESFRKKKLATNLLMAFISLLVPSVLTNLDLIKEALGFKSFVSHRTEFGFGDNSDTFLQTLKDSLFSEKFHYEAVTNHLMVYIAIAIALILMIVFRSYKIYSKNFAILLGSILGIILISDIFHMNSVNHFLDKMGGLFSSFNFERVFYFLPGLWYILLGYCGTVILKSFKEHFMVIGLVVMLGVMFICFRHLAKDKEGIFYQNINQINNGESVTGYLTMKNVFAESLMEEINETIGKDKSTYRVVHIGISPVVSLINGFYTVDGYSNN